MTYSIANQPVTLFKEYVESYTVKDCCSKGNIFVDDMLYGIGISINHELYSGVEGYTLFKNLLLEKLFRGERIYFEGEVK